ncbi:MAG: AMP-binding protein [Candidatus Obscuribacterales bacterium]|nr:AMP-binding protein [Candidatus Obscuribacterales bacterium]
MEQAINVGAILDDIAANYPDRAVFMEVERDSALTTTTYGDLLETVNRRSLELSERGIANGDIVLLLEPVSKQLYIDLLALLKLGACALFLDPGMSTATMKNCLREVKPKAMIASGFYKILATVTGLSAEIDCSKKLDSDPVKALTEDSPALITFTSGSSGRAKAIVRSHGFLRNQLAVLKKELAITETRIELTALPMFVLANIASGACTVLSKAGIKDPKKASVKVLKKELSISGADSILASPSLVGNLVEYLKEENSALLNLKTVFTGGGTVRADMIKAAARVFPEADIITVYGSSEAEPIAHLKESESSQEDRDLSRRGAGLLVGSVIDEIELRVLPLDKPDDNVKRYTTHLKELHGDACFEAQTGEIIVSGAHVVEHYLLKEDEIGRKLDLEGRRFHRTGDYGYLDSRGRLWLTGSVAPGNNLSYAAEETARAVLKDNLQLAFYKNHLYIETRNSPGPAPVLFNRLRMALAFAGPTEISTVANIALDRRHNTKVLYKELERRALLSGRGRLFILGDQGLIFRFFKSINLRSRYAHRG